MNAKPNSPTDLIPQTHDAASLRGGAAAAAVAVIPARYDSVRLPGKPLRLINNQPLILHTVARAKQAQTISEVFVATDDKRIFDVCAAAQVRVVMTNPNHQSGTDRIVEAVNLINDDGAEIIVNVQGDEPLIAPETIDAAVQLLIGDASLSVATTCEKIHDARDVLSPDVVKVVCDANGTTALYFSRSPIPYLRELVRRHGSLEQALANERSALGLFRKHTGLYAYRREFLLNYSHLPASDLEQTESLEQLRVLQGGYKIGVVETAHHSIGVDTEADLERVQQLLARGNERM